MTFWLLYVGIASAIAVLTARATLRRTRQGREMRLLSDSAHARLAGWAAARGWTIAEGTSVHVADMLDRVAGLIGEPGDWDLRSGDAAGADHSLARALRKWEFGSVLTQRAESGRIALVSCWREGTLEPHVLAAVNTAVALPPFTLDHLADGGLHRQGSPPPLVEGCDPEEALRGLRRPARLRTISDEIMLSAPGQLTPELADELAARLVRLRDAVLVPPGLGPLR